MLANQIIIIISKSFTQNSPRDIIICHYHKVITVRPPLSHHVGTKAHPDKAFGQIWETQCLLHIVTDVQW